MTDAELLRAILDASPDVVWFIDLAGRYVAVSPAAARFVGRPAAEVVGLTCRDLFPAAIAERWESQFRTVLATGSTLTTEERITVDGEERVFVSRQRVARGADGTVLGVSGFAQDVTAEQRQTATADAAQVAFDRVYEGMLTPAFTWRRLGDDFVLVRANQAARRMTEDRIHGWVGARASAFYEGAPLVLEALRRAWHERTAVRLEDLPYRTRTTGEERRIIASFVPTPPDTVTIHVQDITSLTAVMDALKRQVAEQEAIAALGRAALSGTDLPALYQRAAELSANTLGFDAAGVLERQADGGFVLRGGAGRYAALRGQVIVQPGEGSHAGHAWTLGEPVIVDDFLAETRFHVAQVVQDAGIRSGVAAPILTPEGPWGVLGVHSRRASAFSTDDADFVVAIANVLGAAVAHHTAADARARSERLLHAVFDALDEAVIVVATGAERRLVDINGAGANLMGVARAEMLGGTAERFHLDAAHYREFGARLLAAFARGDTAEIEFPLRRGDGETFLADTRNTLVRGTDGRPEVIVGTIRDLTARRRLEQELRMLSRRLIEVQETQRREVARELHDEVGQLLTAVRMNLLGFRFPAGSAEAQRVADTLDMLGRGSDALRAIQLHLRPPLLDDLGLAPALAWYARRQTQNLAVQLTLEVDETMARVEPATENACFRIAQEALTNTLRHAAPRALSVALRLEGASLVLEVRDDGVGFDPAMPRDPEHSGLAGMRERARGAGGTLEVASAPGAGTLVRAVFPVMS